MAYHRVSLVMSAKATWRVLIDLISLLIRSTSLSWMNKNQCCGSGSVGIRFILVSRIRVAKNQPKSWKLSTQKKLKKKVGILSEPDPLFHETDPDPCQNETDLQHCTNINRFRLSTLNNSIGSFRSRDADTDSDNFVLLDPGLRIHTISTST